MPATVHKIREISASSRNGLISRLQRQVLVTGLVDTDQGILTSALSALDADFAAGSTPGAPYPTNLILMARNPSAVADRDGVVDVELVYETSTRGQNLTGLAFGGLIPEVSTSVASLESNLDADGNEVRLSHVYPSNDSSTPGVREFFGKTLAERTISQRGKFSFQEAQPELHVRFTRTTDFPELLTRALAGAVNARPWHGGDAREWMCTRANARPLALDASPASYEFSFSFAFNGDGWDPEVVFIDHATGEPPPNLIEGQGHKRVAKHRAEDFERLLGARVLGG